ncbi:hypothetical protein KAU39_00495 [bacterium]|nr:hypothetical protein [bacterium]
MRKFIPLTFFGIAMGFAEAAVVVYLRKIIYPEGFCFPLKDIPVNLLFTEIAREVATIIMLVSLALLAGKTFNRRIAFFLYSFGIWDIFYYVWLKVTLNWPASLFTKDILFLIPGPWVGPVLAPVIVSLTMITFSLIIVHLNSKGYILKLNKTDCFLIFCSALIIFVSFMLDCPRVIAHQMPFRYRWELFIIGEFLALFTFTGLCLKKQNIKRNDT